MPPRVADIRQTCTACPTQWEGRLDDGRPFYIRYRHQQLEVHFGPPGGTVEDAIDAAPWFEASLPEGDPWEISLGEVCRLTGLETPLTG